MEKEIWKENENDIKIGSRILGKIELDKLLPNNKDIFNQIDKFREVAQKFRNQGNEDKEFLKEFTNVFSILGERGSGKTSVLLTLKYEINKNSNCDYMFPLIIPENMEDSNDVLGWIIAYFNNIISNKNFEKMMNDYYDSNGMNSDNFQCCKRNGNELKIMYKELQKAYNLRKKEYKQILREQYVGVNEYIYSANDVLISDQKLIRLFNKFIEELIVIKRHCYKREPLFFIFFDDVDLNNDRAPEVLFTILKYLTNSNFVVFVSGNYNNFLEAITIYYLKKDNILNDQMNKKYSNTQQTALDLRKKLSKDFLKKVLPPALRYELPVFTDKMKLDFVFTTESNDNHQNLKKLILEKFELNNDSKENRNCSFLYYKGSFLEEYFTIFDNTPRGLMNVYYYFYNLNKALKYFNKQDFCQFLNIIVNSSTELSEQWNEISRLIRISENVDDTFIDYEYLKGLFEDSFETEVAEVKWSGKIQKLERKMDAKEENIEIYLRLFILLNFVENVVICATNANNSRNVHGQELLHNILQNIDLCKGIKLFPKTNDIGLLLKLHELLHNNIPISNLRKLDASKEKSYFVKVYFESLEKVSSDKLINLFKDVNKYDKEWVDNKIDIICKYGMNDKEVFVNICNDNLKKFLFTFHEDLDRVSLLVYDDNKENLNKLIQFLKDQANKINIKYLSDKLSYFYNENSNSTDYILEEFNKFIRYKDVNKLYDFIVGLKENGLSERKFDFKTRLDLAKFFIITYLRIITKRKLAYIDSQKLFYNYFKKLKEELIEYANKNNDILAESIININQAYEVVNEDV